MPVCLVKTSAYHSRPLAKPSSSMMAGCSICERLRIFSIVVWTISRTSLSSVRKGESGGKPLRSARASMAPTAVRIWPNSSWSSRDTERSTSSCNVMRRAARMRRCWDNDSIFSKISRLE